MRNATDDRTMTIPTVRMDDRAIIRSRRTYESVQSMKLKLTKKGEVSRRLFSTQSRL